MYKDEELHYDIEQKFLICDKKFTKQDNPISFIPAGWNAFKFQVKQWTPIDFGEYCHEFVYSFQKSNIQILQAA